MDSAAKFLIAINAREAPWEEDDRSITERSA